MTLVALRFGGIASSAASSRRLERTGGAVGRNSASLYEFQCGVDRRISLTWRDASKWRVFCKHVPDRFAERCAAIRRANACWPRLNMVRSRLSNPSRARVRCMAISSYRIGARRPQWHEHKHLRVGGSSCVSPLACRLLHVHRQGRRSGEQNARRQCHWRVDGAAGTAEVPSCAVR